jgi:hypothetical protein
MCSTSSFLRSSTAPRLFLSSLASLLCWSASLRGRGPTFTACILYLPCENSEVRIACETKTDVVNQRFRFCTMNLIALLYIIFQCIPVSYAWNTSTPGGKCNPAQYLADIYYATTAVNIATDWFCALLPVPLLWNVRLNRNAKISVGVILGLGAL